MLGPAGSGWDPSDLHACAIDRNRLDNLQQPQQQQQQQHQQQQ